ncbi:MAG: hypothetical protein CAF41_012615 [Nitrospira sp. CG24A]|nr:MAG: hypothetical protein CAF41_012615 [Nitrospira sp. CG24A]
MLRWRGAIIQNIDGSATKKAVVAVVILFIGGCATVAQVTSLSDQNCRHTFVDRMSSILVEQGEKQEVAEKLAEATTTVLLTGSLGPRPFLVASPSGADYGFFVEQKSSDCLLRLFSRQKGFTRYRNNLTYIGTRQLDGCMCAE